jgi:hypothetical protein
LQFVVVVVVVVVVVAFLINRRPVELSKIAQKQLFEARGGVGIERRLATFEKAEIDVRGDAIERRHERQKKGAANERENAADVLRIVDPGVRPGSDPRDLLAKPRAIVHAFDAEQLVDAVVEQLANEHERHGARVHGPPGDVESERRIDVQIHRHQRPRRHFQRHGGALERRHRLTWRHEARPGARALPHKCVQHCRCPHR